MTGTAAEVLVTNPFCTRRVRPGAIPFFFAGHEGLAALCQSLCGNGWRGEIVGPHGTGKSTLLAALVKELESIGRRPCMFQIRDDSRRMPAGWVATLRRDRVDTVVIDGFELIRRWSRRWVQYQCRRLGAGLLVTAHAPCGLPPLFRTNVTPEIARRVVDYLCGGADAATLDALTDRLTAHGGNLREALFDLYDRFEQSRGYIGCSADLSAVARGDSQPSQPPQGATAISQG